MKQSFRPGLFIAAILVAGMGFLALTMSARSEIVEQPAVLKVRMLSEFKPETVKKLVHWAVLQLALEKSGQAFDLDVSAIRAAPYRTAQIMASSGNQANVRSMRGGGQQTEPGMLPVYVPTFRGLLSYWNIWVRAGDADKFADIQTLDALRKLSVVQGQWFSVPNFEREGFVMRIGSYRALPKMLVAGRADALPYPILETAVMFGG